MKNDFKKCGSYPRCLAVDCVCYTTQVTMPGMKKMAKAMSEKKAKEKEMLRNISKFVKGGHKSKYVYVIVDSKTNAMLLDCGRLPIFYRKKVANNSLKDFTTDTDKYCIKTIELKDLYMSVNFDKK
jgi:hypothetical protein